MYTRLSKIMTKSYFREILQKAIEHAEHELSIAPNIPMNISFYKQLIDIKKTVVDENKIFTEDEADDKYPLGVMAIRNFDGYEGFEYKDMLVDVSYGIPFYPNMPED